MKKRRGFSLVELLIVISLMIVLAGGLALSMRGGLVKAQVSRALSDLSGLRTAAMLYQSDTVGTVDENKAPTKAQLARYLEGMDESKVVLWPGEGVEAEHWYVGLTGIESGGALGERLAKQADTMALLAGDSGEPSGKYAGGTTVWVKVR